MNADNLLFRSHMIGAIMPSDKARVPFTIECMDKMVEMYNFILFNRREEIKSKYLRKGNDREEDSITLVSRVTKTLFHKNETRLQNKYITGIPDLWEGEVIQSAKRTLDTKSSWSKNTFDKARIKPLEKDYYWQGQAYMALTGAGTHTVAFCLVNGTAKLILDEKRKAQWQLGIIDPYTEPRGESEKRLFANYKLQCQQIEINHIFDLKHFMEENPGFDLDIDPSAWIYDVPMEQRIYQFHIERNDADIERMYRRIIECRKWMNDNLFSIAPKPVAIAA